MLKYLDILQFKLLVLVFGGAAVWIYLRRIDIRDRLLVVCDRLAAHERIFLVVLLVTSFFLQVFIADGVLLDFPNSGDEYAYFLQAKMFSSGRLWSDPHPEAPFFRVCHVAQLEGKRVSRYPPGWPLILALGMILRIPTVLLNPLMGTLGLWIFYLLGRRFYGKPTAILSSLAFLFSSFFLFNGGSYFSHSSCLLMILLSIYFLDRYEAQPNRWFAIAAGFAMGYAFITRYYTALLVSIVVGLYLIWKRLWKRIPYLILGALPPLLFLFFYNSQVTGNPFHLVTRWMDPAEKLGFVKGHTFLRAMDHILAHHYDFIQWTSPALLFLYAYFLIANISRKEKYGIRYLFIALVIGHILFYSLGGNRYGPRYYYEGYPFMLLFCCRKYSQSGREEGVVPQWPHFIFPIGFSGGDYYDSLFHAPGTSGGSGKVGSLSVSGKRTDNPFCSILAYWNGCSTIPAPWRSNSQWIGF